MKKRYFLIGFLLLGTAWVNAQTLSLDSCKALAVHNNAKVQNAALDIDITRQTKNESLTKYFPNLKLSGIGYHALNPLLEVGIDDVPNANVRALLNTFYAEYGATLGLPNRLIFSTTATRQTSQPHNRFLPADASSTATNWPHSASKQPKRNTTWSYRNCCNKPRRVIGW